MSGMELVESEATIRGDTLKGIPLPLPDDVVERIEFLALRNLVHDRNKALHKELLETEIFLSIVDTRNWDGKDYSFAYRIPPLISGSASDFDDSDFSGEDFFGGGGGGEPDATAAADLQALLHGWHQAMQVQLGANNMPALPPGLAALGMQNNPNLFNDVPPLEGENSIIANPMANRSEGGGGGDGDEEEDEGNDGDTED